MDSHQDTMTVWREFEALHARGAVRHLGISNIYDPRAFAAIYKDAKVKPAVVQNRQAPACTPQF
jgi:diketogulonate reductase-like aldo/keto reductase